jgi:putative membrane-bound dehydrogenase-like protein
MAGSWVNGFTRSVLVAFALFLSPHGFPAAAPAAVPALEVPDGFEVIPAALPPLVSFPMLGSFDERGRLFIAENAGVNLDEKALDAQLPSHIRMLEDLDGDGVFDRSKIFADKLAFPQGAVWHDGALYVTSAPAVWRLEDRDGDGRADTRTAIATGFKSTGNAADVHGPFLHPNGRLYWCHGRKGHEVYQNGGGALVSKGLGARIWSCRPDGSDIQVHAGGGMDNPVEVAFNQEGEIFGTANLFHGTPRADAIVHWVHGGVYPRNDQEPVLAEFTRSGDLLGPVTLIGHVAPAGIALPRAATWPEEYRNNLFHAEFNTRRIMRVPLERHGSTYRGHARVFASAADPGVHFTGVIEDADGSILLVNTGAWFRRGCPTSIVARADLTGGIYRVRPRAGPRAGDPRGQAVDWDRAAADVLAGLLGDPRVAVRDRAVTALARRGGAAVAALEQALGSKEYLARSNAVWALTRIATPAAQAAVRGSLLDGDARVREAACQSVFVTVDGEAAESLVARLGDDSPAVQREAARALGRLRNAAAVPALGGAAAIRRDPVLTHALVHALIEIDAPAATRRLLDHREPLARRAALIALDRSPGGNLDAAPVFAALRTDHADLRTAALDIAVRRPEWGAAATDYLSSALGGREPRPPAEIVQRLLAAFLPAAEMQAWVRSQLAPRGSTGVLDRRTLLEAIAAAANAWDDAWREILITGLRSADAGEAESALKAVAAHRNRNFAPELRRLGQDATRSTTLRVSALQLAAGGAGALDADSFALLIQPLRGGGLPGERLQAATILSGARLDLDQLLQVADLLPAAGPIELQQLMGAFQRGPAEAAVGTKLLAQLQQTGGRFGVLPQTLHAVFQRYPAPAHENAGALIAEISNQNVAKDSRIAEVESLVAGGDPARGRTAYFAGAGACLSCHRIGDTGGTLGPDLSQIGRIRTTRDLIEAIAFPNATIARGYETIELQTRDGRAYMGTIQRETSDTVFVLTADGREQPVPRAAIAKLEPVAVSLMPPGLDRTMEPNVLADLVAFLATRQ